ncbi:MAG: redoxin domain-containing protein [Planctomycetota bacterium]|jgi:peroxiredoxin
MPRPKILLVAVALSMLSSVALSRPQTPQAQIGQPAPNFTLRDLDGNARRLSELKGKTVVLHWINPACPFIVRIYERGVVSRTLAQMKLLGADVVMVAIDSTGNIAEEEVIDRNRRFLATHEIDIPVLIDHDGRVGRQYGARTTPHMFVIDGQGILRYHGEFTNDPSCRKSDSINRVVNALKQLKNGETVSPDTVRPWGCSIKYGGK